MRKRKQTVTLSLSKGGFVRLNKYSLGEVC
jgi:hypothetical protein